MMSVEIARQGPHPRGEVISAGSKPISVPTLGRSFHVEWDDNAPVTPMGQLVFFAQFLGTADLFGQWVRGCPLEYTSPNAPAVQDVLGTMLLSVLSGHRRYAHVTALRGDKVNPQGLGMNAVCSEDSVRRAFKDIDSVKCAKWQQEALLQSYEPALRRPWILDLDVTIKPIYGNQEGAEVGYNPQKPGRPSHAYHSLFIRNLRMALDVVVKPGKQHHAKYGLENLWRWWESVSVNHRPYLICGDCGFGNEDLMSQCEERKQRYLYRLRQTPGVKELIGMLERGGGWEALNLHGWSGLEGQLQLKGWSRKRRVVVLRRKRSQEMELKALAQKTQEVVEIGEPERAQQGSFLEKLNSTTAEIVSRETDYEYQVMVTDVKESILGVADLYRQRADAENGYDELKNQWGWGGFMTQDLLRCQVTARTVALVYNWWTSFVMCADPQQGREAITSRPLLLTAVGRLVETGRQLTLKITNIHGEGKLAERLMSELSLFLSGLRNTAEQLNPKKCFDRIWERILAPYLVPKAQLRGASG